ncbi:MAG: hypothetical protein J7L07_02955 [Candidatus Odinarchaeota archaeon]|nr:hypothetical protein [Candidatus Odinarchaeota archaeon]
MGEQIGMIVSDREPTIYEAEIKLTTSNVRPLEYVVAKFKEDNYEYGVVMRIVNIRERNKYAASHVFDVEEKTG